MESKTFDRVDEASSNRRKRRREDSESRKVLANPSSLDPGSSQKKKRREKKASSDVYYSLREIVEEKREQGRTLYLIDWENNSETSEVYDQSWEPRENVTEGAIEDWELKRRKEGSPLRTPSHTESSVLESAPDSQPIRPAKRSRLDRGYKPSLPTSKKPRRAGTAKTARFQSVSQEESLEVLKEIKDSYEEELSNESAQIQVLLPPIDQSFDRSAYKKLSFQSSQPPEPSQPSRSSQVQSSHEDSYSWSSQPSQPSQPSIYSASRFKTPKHRPRPFIWDEDPPLVIPDSQALPGSSPYKPSEISTSKTGSTRPYTQTSEDTNFESPIRNAHSRSSPFSIESSTQVRRHFEPSISRRKEREVDANTETLSSHHRSAASSADTTASGEQSHPNTLPHTAPDHIVGVLCGTVAARHNIRPESTGSPSTHLSPPPPEPSLREQPLSSGCAHQFKVSYTEESERSSPKFQTQLPLSAFTRTSNEVTNHVIDKSAQIANQDDSNQSQPSRYLHSQTLAVESRRIRSRQPTQQSISSFEATWQAAQVVVPGTELSSLHSAAIAVLEDGESSLPRNTSHGGETQASSKSALSQLDPNTVGSLLVTQADLTQEDSGKESTDKESNYRPHQNPEHVIESIERGESSSLIPPRPSPTLSRFEDLLHTYHETSVGQRASSEYCVDEMADHFSSGSLSVAAMLRETRAKAAAATMARQATERKESVERREASMSAIPPTPPPVVNRMLPLRDPAIDLQTTVTEPKMSPKPSPEPSQTDQGVKTSVLQILPLGPREYVVPLPMASGVRAIYDTELRNNKRHINALQDDRIEAHGINELSLMLEKMELLCDHQDLIVEDYATQENLSDTLTTRFAENISTKCQFMAGLLKQLRLSNDHIAILVRPERMRRMLESMCRYYDIGLSGSSQFIVYGQPTPLRVTLVSTDQAEDSITTDPVCLVIAFDASSHGRSYSKLRGNPKNPNQLAPLVHLVVTHSIEHLKMCIDNQFDSFDRMTALVSGVVRMRDEMGKLNAEDYLEGELAGEEVAKYIKNPDSLWPLLPMPEIEGLEFETETPPESQEKPSQPSGSTTQSHHTSSLDSLVLQSGQKRSLGIGDEVDSSKRQRLTPNPKEENRAAFDENSRIVDSVILTSNGTSTSNKAGTQTVPEEEEDDQISVLLKRINALEGQLRNKEAAEAELRQLNQRLKSRCTDLEQSIQTIQPKYQEALNDQGSFQHDLNEALGREASLRQKHDSRVAELAKAREEKAAINAELIAARQSLSTSAVPEVAEFNTLKEDLRIARSEIDRHKKKNTNMQSEMDYMRGHYQTASSAAADARSEIDELKEENGVLARKASNNALEIHKIQSSEEIKQLMDRIDELQASNVEMDRELERKNEELRTLMNGRRSTRGTSVPRSPRMGTMSPNVRERPISRVLGSGVGSRGNSPAPGDGPPFRGAFGFGDVLFPEKGAARWGNHLS